VGSGHGHFLTAYAAAHPRSTCVGIDISAERVARAVRKQRRAGLGNLHFVLADAGDFLSALPDGSGISEIFILFPDPWPKRRHHKNRLMTVGFLAGAAAAAGKGARLFFRTDHEPYFREAEALLHGHADWEPSPESLLPFEEPTVFEKRAPRHFTLVATRR
jgi:tRNA (guanine-N7-)-methyltransferase